MRPFSSISLLVKLPLILCLIVVGVASTIGVAMVRLDRQRLTESLEEKSLLLARSIAVTAAEPVLRGDFWTLFKALRQITRGPGGEREGTLITAMILDPEGRVLAHIDPAHFPIGLRLQDLDPNERVNLPAVLAARQPKVLTGDGFIEGVAPVRTGGETVGVVRLRLSTSELDRTMAEAGRLVMLLALGLAMAGSLIGLALSLSALRPLRALAGSMSALAQGKVTPLPVSRTDEIGQLISRFNRMTEELDEKRRLADQLAANEKIIALGRIAAGVAHEVNNPLAGMLNCLSTLRSQSNDPELVARYLPMIENGLRRIEALVKDLLIELRVEDAQGTSDASCLEDVRDLIVSEIDPAKVLLVWENELKPGDAINPMKMQQIVLNLARNAIQAMPDGGKLACRFSSNAREMVFEIRDTGHGIKDEDLPRIFDPFFTSRPTGTGLGLWIVIRLVSSLKGGIDVDSAPGRGTSFRVRIPREASLADQSA